MKLEKISTEEYNRILADIGTAEELRYNILKPDASNSHTAQLSYVYADLPVAAANILLTELGPETTLKGAETHATIDSFVVDGDFNVPYVSLQFLSAIEVYCREKGHKSLTIENLPIPKSSLVAAGYVNQQDELGEDFAVAEIYIKDL